ncbi:MAG: DNA replication/repair protein RecF [Lachnospiraceae bacterium]|nr:DNA replication/repair protein RecF [Lachnospiraceae bacterium]
MIVKSLELSNFRNYENLSIEFSKGANILYGDNAQGKTNILEGVYLCATTKSHRGSKDREVIMLEKEESHLRMIINRDGIDRRIDMHLKKNKPKGVAIDGIPIKKSTELFGIINVVSFSPEDLSIIKSGPGERRRFIDMELCQLDRFYLHNLMNYNKVLNQRNNLLKQIGFNRSLLDTIYVWDEQLIEYGKQVVDSRQKFVDELRDVVKDLHSRITCGKETLEVFYEPNTDVEQFVDRLGKSLERDIVLKSTSVGPHRDDLRFQINGIDIRKYGSQGQQRTSALSLKLAEIELVKKRVKDQPILLLDDVLSELDRHRQHQLLDSIADIQTIVTCTGLEEFVKVRSATDNVYQVVNGEVFRQENNV